MQINQLIAWTKSPIAGRRRKAIKKLTKFVLNNPEKIKEFYDLLKDMIADENWSVRSTVVSSIAEIASLKDEIRADAISILLGLIENDEPNVRASALQAIRKIIAKDPNLINDDILRASKKALDDENPNVREAALNLTLELSKYDAEILTDTYSIVLTLAKDSNPRIRESALRILVKNIDKMTEDQLEDAKNIFYERTTDERFEVRKLSIEGLMKLFTKGLISYSSEIANLVRKKLRDPAIPVRITALNFVVSIIEKNARYSDDFLDIITKEILLREKNLNLLKVTIEILDKYVDNIPEDIINKHDVPRTLDILEKSIIPKSPDKARLKASVRQLLEDKLGYTYEIRKKMWGEISHQEK